MDLFSDGRRSEHIEVRQTQTRFNLFHTLQRRLESITTKLLCFDVFKLVAELIVLTTAYRCLPCGKDNCIFDRGVVLIHPDKRLQRLREWLDTVRWNAIGFCDR